MSKSLGNYVAINDAADDMFGKLMSISDTLMWRYFELLSFRPLRELALLRQQVADGRNPRDVKMELAAEITARFHDAAAATRAQADFLALSQKVLPTDLPEVVSSQTGLTANLVSTGLASSGSDARRKIAEGAVRVNGEKVSDAALHLAAGSSYILQIGPRRFAQVRIDKRA
jgi:tyrosyl-tRNA synthetase